MSKLPNVGEQKTPSVQIITPSTNVDISPRTNSEKLAHLVKQTGMEKEIAKEFLDSNGWNLHEALDGFQKLVIHEQKTEENDKKNLSTYDLEKRKVSRGFSLSNFHLIHDEREQQKTVVCEDTENTTSFKVFGPSAQQSFLLPNISRLDKDVANIIITELISRSTLVLLTNQRRLNWWSSIGACRKLFPLSTVGDGNCLLHAVSLGMWGFHDRMLILRKALHQMLLNPLAKKALKRRWKYNLWMENMKCGGLTYTRDEWENEWEMMVNLSSNVPYKMQRTESKYKRISRQHSLNTSNAELEEGESLDSLETIHVYALANLLCRPIIIISVDMLKDANGRDIAPIPFGGIYLPLEQDISVCYKYPLVLAYESSHFSALVPADGDNTQNGERLSSSVPLQHKDMSFLPIKYVIDPGSSWDMVQDDSMKEEKPELTLQDDITLLRKYLDVVKVPSRPPSPTPPRKLEKDFRVGSVIDHVADIFGTKVDVPLPTQPSPMIIAAKLNTKNRPKHYKEMIENFIDTKMVEAHELRQSQSRCSSCGADAVVTPNNLCQWCDERSKITKSGRLTNHKPFKSSKTKLSNSSPPMLEQAGARSNSTLPRHSSSTSSSTSSLNKLSPPMSDGSSPQEMLRLPAIPIFDSSNLPLDLDTADGVVKNEKIKAASATSVERDCFEEPRRSMSMSTTRRPASRETSPLPVKKVHSDEDFRVPGKLCKASGCKFYGNKQTLGFCSSCYRKYNNGVSA